MGTFWAESPDHSMWVVANIIREQAWSVKRFSLGGDKWAACCPWDFEHHRTSDVTGPTFGWLVSAESLQGNHPACAWHFLARHLVLFCALTGENRLERALPYDCAHALWFPQAFSLLLRSNPSYLGCHFAYSPSWTNPGFFSCLSHVILQCSQLFLLKISQIWFLVSTSMAH